MKSRLLIVIACSGITFANYSLATSRGLAPPQQENGPVGYTQTFTPIGIHCSYSYPFHGYATTDRVVFFWNGESNADPIEFRIASLPRQTNWSTVAEIAPTSNLQTLGTLDGAIGTLDETSHSYRFVVYTPITRPTISTTIDANLARVLSGNTWLEPSINWSTLRNELAFNWIIGGDFASAKLVDTKLFGDACLNSTNRNPHSCTGYFSMTQTLKPPSVGGGSLLAIVTGAHVAPVNPTGG